MEINITPFVITITIIQLDTMNETSVSLVKQQVAQVYNRKRPDQWYPFPYLRIPASNKLNPYDEPLGMLVIVLREDSRGEKKPPGSVAISDEVYKQPALRQLKEDHETTSALKDILTLPHQRMLDNLSRTIFMNGCVGYYDAEQNCLVSGALVSRSLKLIIELNSWFPELVADYTCALFSDMLELGSFESQMAQTLHTGKGEVVPNAACELTPSEASFMFRRGHYIYERKKVYLANKVKAAIYLDSAATVMRMPCSQKTRSKLTVFDELRMFKFGFKGTIGSHLDMTQYPLYPILYNNNHQSIPDVKVIDHYITVLRWLYATACYDPDNTEFSLDPRAASNNFSQVVFASDWNSYYIVRKIICSYFWELRQRQQEEGLYTDFLSQRASKLTSVREYNTFINNELSLYRYLKHQPAPYRPTDSTSRFLAKRKKKRVPPSVMKDQSETGYTEIHEPLSSPPNTLSYPRTQGGQPIMEHTTEVLDFDPSRPYTVLANVSKKDPNYNILYTLCAVCDIPVTASLQNRHRSWINALKERHPGIDLELAMSVLDLYVTPYWVTPALLCERIATFKDTFPDTLAPYLLHLINEVAESDGWMDIPPLSIDRRFELM